MTRRSLLKALAAVVAVTPGLKLLTCQHDLFKYRLESGELTAICLRCHQGWSWPASEPQNIPSECLLARSGKIQRWHIANSGNTRSLTEQKIIDATAKIRARVKT